MEKSNTKALAPIKARVTKMTVVVSGLVIKDTVSLRQAIAIRSGIKDVMKQVKEWKDARIKPLQESEALLRADVRPLEDYCKEAEAEVNKKMIAYDDKIKKEEAKKVEKIAEKVEAGKMSIQTASKKMEALPEIKTTVEGDKGKVTFRKHKNFKVVDLSKLPIEYHIADEVAIRKAMYSGIELAGVNYFEETKIG